MEIQVDDALEKREQTQRNAFWMKFAGFAFSAWALLLPISAAIISNTVSKVGDAQQVFNASFNEYRQQVERRLTLLEDRQATVLRWITEHDPKIDDIILQERLHEQETKNGKH